MVFAVLLLAGALAPAAAAQRPLKVAAAANVRGAFEEIERAFERAHPEIDVEVTYGASGNFFAQIVQGAPFDLFLSADAIHPEKLGRAGRCAGAPFDYAIGHLVLWARNGSPVDVRKGLAALAHPSVRKVAVANARLAPYGKAADEVLATRGLREGLRKKFVYGENVVQTAQFAETGAADAGFIALSLALTPAMQAKGRYWLIPGAWHAPIRQSGVVIRGGNERDAARFRTFLQGNVAGAILERYGYGLPGDDRAAGAPAARKND